MNDKNAVMMEKSELMKLVDITPYANNPRKNDRAIEPVMNSIREFGFNQPIVVDKDHVIIVGHTRYLAALELGLEEVPVYVAAHLSEEQARAYSFQPQIFECRCDRHVFNTHDTWPPFTVYSNISEGIHKAKYRPKKGRKVR